MTASPTSSSRRDVPTGDRGTAPRTTRSSSLADHPPRTAGPRVFSPGASAPPFLSEDERFHVHQHCQQGRVASVAQLFPLPVDLMRWGYL